MKLSRLAPALLVSGIFLLPSCRAAYQAKAPDLDEGKEENLVGAKTGYSDEVDEEEALDEQYGKREELPPPKTPTKKCRGKGKKRKCTMHDPDPALTAAHAVRKFTQGFRWKMPPNTVMETLTQKIDQEYDERQAAAEGDANKQDANRRWREEQKGELSKNMIRFDTRSKHKWGVSLIQYDYVDDENEEMVWIKANPQLKKFFFFKDQEMWKVVYAYSEDSWPGKKYDEIVEEKFKKWFGVSPEVKTKADPESGAEVLKYLEWKTRDGDIVRSFDMTAVHGVVVITFVDSKAEEYIGERLPNIKKDETFADDVNDVLGGTDVCYDEAGNLIEDAEKCKELE
jgi:hypothetical protein